MKKWLAVSILAAGCTGSPTGETGGPLDPMLEGSTYVMQVGGLTVTGADEGLNDLVKLAFQQEVLVDVDNVTDASFSMGFGLGLANTDPIERNPCFDIIAMPPVTLDGLNMSLGPQDITFPAAFPITLSNFEMSAAFSDDGERITDVQFSGGLDFRIAEGSAFGEPTELCETFDGFGVPCVPCDDGEVFCSTLEVTGVGATRQEGILDARAPEPGECDE